ncbi:helix-turn-helix domain-containing protein, partial [Escherichia coli]|uniref:helix-turn-helix domain-containing protein n=1 Tax=Escherichia coli TaxID=562 RepID=UPI003C2FB791
HDLTGVPYGTLSYYESGRSTPPTDVMMNILQTPQFTKYTLWFMTNQIAPESGQIAPALAHFGQNETTSPHSGQKTG